MNKFKRLSFVLVIFALLASACGGASNLINGIDVPGRLDQANKYYHDGVSTHEVNTTNLWAAYIYEDNDLRTSALDIINTATACFTNVEATQSAISQAALGELDKTAIASSLTTGNLTGDAATVECTKIYAKLADTVISHRAAIKVAHLAAIQAANGYMAYLTDWPEVAIMNDLLQTVGNDGINKVYKMISDRLGVGITDWSWLPTKNLYAIAGSDKKLCDYYTSGTFIAELDPGVREKFKGHDDSLKSLYLAVWNSATNNGRGECRLYRFAALLYMTRQVVSQSTSDNQQNGSDTGIFPTATPKAR